MLTRKRNEQDEMVSLYNYLGRAAGPKLGKHVYEWVRSTNRSHLVKNRDVATNSYKGLILVYPKGLLNEYFTIHKDNLIN